MAIIYPEPTTLDVWCRENEPSAITFSQQVQSPKVRQLIQDDMDRLARESRLNSLEQIKGNFRLIETEFEIGTVLTPTMKLRRQEAKKYFSELIKDMYKS